MADSYDPSNLPAVQRGPGPQPTGWTPYAGIVTNPQQQALADETRRRMSDPYTAIQALYKQYGIQDAGRGSGFADLNYWADAANRSGGWSDYWQNRLGSDLAGTGTDQPTGTPGQGPWQQSGRGGSMPRTTMPSGPSGPSPSPGGWWNPPGYTPTMVPGGGGGATTGGANPWQQWLAGMPKSGQQADMSQVLPLLAQIFGSDPSTSWHLDRAQGVPAGGGAQGQAPPTANPNLEAIIQRALLGANY